MQTPEELQWSIQDSISPEEERVLNEILEQYNVEQTGLRRATLAILLRTRNGQLVGGVACTVAWGLLYIKILSVHPRLRGQGYGAKLLAAAERQGRAQGCHLAHLHTMSFQAPSFYEKYGYTIFEILEANPPQYKRCFLKKPLI